MKSKSYEEFVEKFKPKPKKTTDDCYTPPKVYDAVAEYVASKYNLSRSNFVRPFYPGGDYESFCYSPDSVVVDNPPFSCLMAIVKYYMKKKIKFFLFAPTLTLFQYAKVCTVLPIGVSVRYDNGARVNTSFMTNLDPESIRIRTDPELYWLVYAADAENSALAQKKKLSYAYPPNVLTATIVYPLSKDGIAVTISKAESQEVERLDAQKGIKKYIFGNGYFVSDEVVERVASTPPSATAAAKRKELQLSLSKLVKEEIEIPLSEREKEIIKNLSCKES